MHALQPMQLAGEVPAPGRWRGGGGQRQQAAAAPPTAAAAGATEPQQRPPRPRHPKKTTPERIPTHFLAVRVGGAEVAAAFARVHDALTQHSPHLRHACVDAASAHITLGVLALDAPGECEAAAAALAALGAALAERRLLHPVEVEFAGLSHFNHRVLYLDLQRDEGLQGLLALADATRSHFQEAQLLLQEGQGLNPHVTVAKTSKLLGRPLGVQGVAAQQPSVAGSSNSGGGDDGGSQGGWGSREGELGSDGKQDLLQPQQPEENMQQQQQQEQQQEQPIESQQLDPPPAQQQQEQQPRRRQGRWRQQQQQQDWRHIPAEAWAQHAGVSAGRVVLSELQLCAMAGRQNGRYYHVLSSLPLLPGG